MPLPSQKPLQVEEGPHPRNGLPTTMPEPDELTANHARQSRHGPSMEGENSGNSAKGLKRKRVTSHVFDKRDLSSLTSQHHTGPMLTLCSSTSTSDGSQTSGDCSMLLKRMNSKGRSMELGLGPNEPTRDCLIYTCMAPATSGERSALTTVNLGAGISMDIRQHPRQDVDALLEPAPWQPSSKRTAIGDGTMNSSSFGKESGTQLQLGLSGVRTLLTDLNYISDVASGAAHGGALPHEQTDIPLVDEGSTSARSLSSGGYMPSLLLGRTLDSFLGPNNHGEGFDVQESMIQTSSGEGGLGFPDNGLDNDLFAMSRSQRGRSMSSLSVSSMDRMPKTCRFKGCGKGARGASGLCITHGGGKRCQKQGCNKGAEGNAIFCKAHGGGRRCTTLGCTRSAEGKTDHCIGHGGGRRCSADGCTKAARGRSGLCIRHGGGKRCQKEGCTKSAEGYSGLCISHGGGRRCQYMNCSKGAQGSTMFCKAHGGGKRCMIQGCNKGAEGSTPLCKGHGGGKRCMFEGGGICTKSVHGGTSFCVAHGGGKRCAVQGCTKSARGRTDFCVRHGGGKRCKFENCSKSAQGSTDFCKAHGGGKRCSWGKDNTPYSQFFRDQLGILYDGSCDRFARGKIGLCAAHSALVQDCRVHGAGTIGKVLPGGIGPGLFRGLVAVSKHKRESFELSTDVSKQSSHPINDKKDHVSDCAESCSLFASGEAAENDLIAMDAKNHMQEVVLSAEKRREYPMFPSSGCELNSFQGLDQLQNDSGVSLLSPPTWLRFSSAIPSQNSKPMTEDAGKSLFLTSPQMHCGSEQIAEQPTNGGSLFYHSLIPPQVLVPLSMQKKDFIASESEEKADGARTLCPDDDNIFKMSSLSLPEERVHGRGLLALLSQRPSEDSR